MPARPHFQRLVERVRNLPALPTAIVYPCDRDSLQVALSGQFAGYLAPVLVTYIADLEKRLNASGVTTQQRFLMQSNGGVMPFKAAVLGHKYNAMYATGDVVANLLPINNLNGPTWRPSPNNTDWNTPEWKDLFAQVATEADPAKQKTLYAKLNDYILDQSWAMPMATNPQVLVGTTKLKGVSVNQYGAWYFTDAWLDS